MKPKYGLVIKLSMDDGIMGHPKLVKAAVDHFYRALWIFPGFWINQSSTMQHFLHGPAWEKIPICYI